MSQPVGSAHVVIDADLTHFADDVKAKAARSIDELSRIVDNGLRDTASTAARAGGRTGQSFTRGMQRETRELGTQMSRQVGEIGSRSRGEAERSGLSIGRSMGETAERGFAQYGRRAGEKFTESAKEATHHIGAAAFAGVGSIALGEVVKGSLEAIDQLEGAEMKTENIFGSAADSVKKWAATLDTSFGMTTAAGEDAAGTYASILRPLSLTPGAAAKASEGLVQLSANLAKAKQVSPAAAQQALIAGLRGRATALRSLGIDISQTAVAQEAARLGLVKATVSTNQVRAAQDNLRVAMEKQRTVDKSSKSSTLDRRLALDAVRAAQDKVTKSEQGTTGKMTDAAKTAAAYKLILEQTTGVTHAYADSSGRAQTQQEKITSQWTDMEAELGRKLMPVLVKLGGYITRDVIPGLEATGRWVERNKAVIEPLAVAIAGLWAVWKGIRIIGDVRDSWRRAFRQMGEDTRTTATQSTEAAGTVSRAQEEQARAVQTSVEEQETALANLREAQDLTARNAQTTSTEIAAANDEAAAGGGGMLVGRGGAGATEEGAARGRGISGAGLAAGLGLTIGGQALGAGAKSGSGRAKAASVVTSAGEGAMIGSVVGPEGAVVGGAVGAAYGAIKEFGSHGSVDPRTVINHATAGIKSMIASGDAWRKNLETLGGTSAVATQRIAAQAVSVAGLTQKAAKAQLTQKDLTNAITGTNAQYDRTIAAWKAGGHPSAQTLATMALLHTEYQSNSAAAQSYNYRMQDSTVAAHAFNARLDGVSAAIRRNGVTLDQDTSFGQKNAAAIREAADAARTHALAVFAQTGSIRQANATLRADIGQLNDSAGAALHNRGAVVSLTSAYSKIPRNVYTHLHLDMGSINAQINDVQRRLGALANRTAAQNTTLNNAVHGIRHTAVGGTFRSAQVRLIGEDGPEAVVPLNRPLSQVDPSVRSLSAIAQGMGSFTSAASTVPTSSSGMSGLDPAALQLLASMNRKLDQLSLLGGISGIGTDMADALNSVTRHAALRGRTSPAGRSF